MHYVYNKKDEQVHEENFSQKSYHQIKSSTHIANTLWQTLSGLYAQPQSWSNIQKQYLLLNITF